MSVIARTPRPPPDTIASTGPPSEAPEAEQGGHRMALRALTRLTGVAAPPGVELTTWTGSGDPPVAPAAVGFYCGPYEEGPQQNGGLAAGMPALEVVQVLSAGVDGVLGGGTEESLGAARALVERRLAHWAAGEPLENVVRGPAGR